MAKANDCLLFNLEEFVSGYLGRPKHLRIFHLVTNNMLDEEDEIKALKILYDELKETLDRGFLYDVSNRIRGRLGDDYSVTPEMRHKMKQEYEKEHGRKTSYLEVTKRHVSNEKRFAYNQGREFNQMVQREKDMAALDLGTFLYENGQAHEAYEILQTIPVTVGLMLVALECEFFHEVISLSLERPDDDVEGDYIFGSWDFFADLCLRGLALMAVKDYHKAACVFSEIVRYSPRWTFKHYSFDLISWDDIHLCCTWLATATMSNDDIKEVARDFERTCDNYQYLYFLRAYIARDYACCLGFLEGHLRPKALLDIYLHHHVDTLVGMIKDQCNLGEKEEQFGLARFLK